MTLVKLGALTDWIPKALDQFSKTELDPEMNSYKVDTVQDFLINFGIKPRMHLLEIYISHCETYQNYEQS